jgi:glycosyltransferase involved in cell wall biosynthesis
MRILHLDTDDIENPLRGGQPVRTYEINRRLAAYHAITVLTATYRGCVKQIRREGLDYQRLGLTIPGWGLSSHLSYLARLGSAIKRLPHDLIVEEFTPPFGFCNTQRFTTQPVVSMVQWFFFDDWQKRYGIPFEQVMRKRATAWSNRHLIVQTNAMGDYFRALIPQANIYKVPCGLNQAAYSQSRGVGEYALFLGRLDIKHKGLDDLLLAWKMLKEQQIMIPLWIVGSGQDEAVLKTTVLNMGLSDLVQFKGRVEGDAKYTLIRNCRLMVMPSRQETFGITALEAMANSKPVVAYDIDHLNEVLLPAWSNLVRLGDVHALSNAVNQYWQSPAYCQSCGDLAYQAAQDYRWDKLAQQQQEIYLNILDHQH